jgi:hypothetical protein
MFEIMLCAPATVDHVSFGCIYPRVKTYSKDDTFTYRSYRYRSAHGCEKSSAKDKTLYNNCYISQRGEGRTVLCSYEISYVEAIHNENQDQKP